MSRIRTNPFTPTFGRMPYALAGRTELIDDVIEGLANQPGDPNRSAIFIGPRGTGKTVLLRTIAQEASAQGWICVNVSAHSGMIERIVSLAHVESEHLIPRKAKTDITSLQVGPVALGRENNHETQPWLLDLRYLVEDLNNQGIGLLVTVDEIDPQCTELVDYIDTYQHFVADGRDVALIMAGLPGQVSGLLQDRHVSFIRRAFQRHLRPIDIFEVEEALFETIMGNGKTIAPEVLTEAAHATYGLAFAVQLVGYYLWRCSYGRDEITMEDVTEAARLSRRELVSSILEPTLSELSTREQQYLEAMAQDDGPSATSDVARRMGLSMSNASNVRHRLIVYGVIADRRMGVVDFELPLMREYLRGELTAR